MGYCFLDIQYKMYNIAYSVSIYFAFVKHLFEKKNINKILKIPSLGRSKNHRPHLRRKLQVIIIFSNVKKFDYSAI